jgi:hypothetical protein
MVSATFQSESISHCISLSFYKSGLDPLERSVCDAAIEVRLFNIL